MQRLVFPLGLALAAWTALTASAQPMQQARPAGPPAARADLPELTPSEVSGLHLARLTVNPADPRPGCRAQVRVDVENRGLVRWPTNAEFRVTVGRRGDGGYREFRVPLLPSGAPPVRLGFDDLPVVNVPFVVIAELQWRHRQANALLQQEAWRRLELTSIEVRPSGQGPRC